MFQLRQHLDPQDHLDQNAFVQLRYIGMPSCFGMRTEPHWGPPANQFYQAWRLVELDETTLVERTQSEAILEETAGQPQSDGSEPM